MKKLQRILMGLLVLGIAVSSCKKKVSVPKVPATPAVPTAVTPKLNGYAGVLAAVKMTFSYPLPVTIPGMPITSADISAEIASAAISNDNYNTLIDAGTIKINDITLEKASNNAYYKMAMTGLTPSSLNITSNTTWNLYGTSQTVSGNFPTFDMDGVPTEINRANNLTLNLSANAGGTVHGYMITIVSGNTSIVKQLDNRSTYTFTSSELQALATAKDNTALIQVCPYVWYQYSIGGKNYLFVKESAAARMININ